MLNISKTQNGIPNSSCQRRLDTITSKKLADEFEELLKSVPTTIIDCASLNYLSSAGLRACS